MSKHDPRVTLRQIADYARYALKLCSGTSLDALLQDRRNALAFERVGTRLRQANAPIFLWNPPFPRFPLGGMIPAALASTLASNDSDHCRRLNTEP